MHKNTKRRKIPLWPWNYLVLDSFRTELKGLLTNGAAPEIMSCNTHTTLWYHVIPYSCVCDTCLLSVSSISPDSTSSSLGGAVWCPITCVIEVMWPSRAYLIPETQCQQIYFLVLSSLWNRLKVQTKFPNDKQEIRYRHEYSVIFPVSIPSRPEPKARSKMRNHVCTKWIHILPEWSCDQNAEVYLVFLYFPSKIVKKSMKVWSPMETYLKVM